MESRIERVQSFLEGAVPDRDFEDERLKIEADIYAGIQESISLGWMSLDDGEQLIREWHERWGRAE